MRDKPKKISIFCILLALIAMIGIGCFFSLKGEAETRERALSLSQEMEIEVAEEVPITFMPYVSESDKQTMEWSLSEEGVVYLTKTKYKLIALKAGETTLTVQSAQYYSTVHIKVRYQNLFERGNFENLDSGMIWEVSNQELGGWRLYTGGSPVAENQLVEVLDDNGNKVIHFRHPTTPHTSVLYQQIGGLSGGQYYVTAKMKGTDVEKDAYVRVNQGNKWGLTQTTKVKGTFDWETYTSDIVRLDEGEKLKVELYFSANTGEVYFDDVQVFKVITSEYNSFTVSASKSYRNSSEKPAALKQPNQIGKMEVGDKVQLMCETYPQSQIDYDYSYSVEDHEILSVVSYGENAGELTALKNGVTNVDVTDRYGNHKKILVAVGKENGIWASIEGIGEESFVAGKEDTTKKIKIQCESSQFELYKYSNAQHGNYYIENQTVIYTPAQDYYTQNGSEEFFEILVYSGDGFCILPIHIRIEGVDDPCTIVDYWHSTPKNTPLRWSESAERKHTAITSEGSYFNGGYLQVSSYDVEVLYPQTKNIPTAQLQAKTEAYRKILGKSTDGSLTISTANGGTVQLRFDGVAQQIQDRYYDSQKKIIFGICYDYTPKDGFVGYDTFDLVIQNGEESITVTNTVYVLPAVEDFKFDSLNFDGIYLLTNDQWLSEVRAGYADKDPYITTWVDVYAKNFANFVPSGVPADSRSYLEQLAILYQVTKDRKYFELCWQQMEAIVKDEEYSKNGTRRLSWGEDSNGFLDAAMVTYSVGFAYSYIKNELTAEQKQIVMKAMYEEGFYWFENLNNVNVLLHGNNHNLLICCDLALAAFAAMSYDQTISGTVLSKNDSYENLNVREMSAQTIMTAFKYLQIALVHYSDSGGFPEGPAYSIYAHKNMVSLLATLYNLYGETNGKINSFGLSDIPGIMNYTNYPLYTSSPNYYTFYYAESEYSNNQPSLLWYARYDESQINAAVLSKMANANEQYNILNLLWYTPGLYERVDLHNMKELDQMLEDHELATFREDFDNEMAVFTGLKGVDSSSGAFSHKNLDSGTFELYALGERFIGNYCDETYNIVVPDGYWDYDYQRWTYYKKSAQGQNTLVINPEKNPVIAQDPQESAPLIRFESNQSGGFSVVDLSRVYKSDAISVLRGLKLFDHRQRVLLQDEFVLREPSTIYWSAHTEARIDLISDKLARLILNGKCIYAQIISELGSFSYMPATALPGTTGKFCNLDNTGVNKLLIRLDDVVSGNLCVVFTKALEEITEFEPMQVVPLADWQLEEDSALPKITAKNIEIDAELGNRFKYVFNPYQYDYVIHLDRSVFNVPNLKVDYDKEKYSLKIEKTSLFQHLTKVILQDKKTKETRTYSFKFIVDTIIDGYEQYRKLEVLRVTGYPDADCLQDGNNTTKLSFNSKQEIIYELAKPSTFTNVLMRFSGGVLNTYYFDIYTSMDQENWECCYFGGSNTNQMGDEVYSLGQAEAKYVKFVFTGEVLEDLTSISKIELYHNGTKPQTSQGMSWWMILCIGLGSGIVVALGIWGIVILLKRRKKIK